VLGQTNLHEAFGGVVRKSRPAPMRNGWTGWSRRPLAGAGVGAGDLDGIAVTAGPGLIGGVLSGVMLARGLAAAKGLPLVPVNHLAGHALTPA
jgi:N6-L-threonylcarbamoyladenine synthase